MSSAPPPRRPASWEVWEKVAPILTPLVVAVVGFFITHSITRIQVGPEFIDLAMEIIEADPLYQPEGVRSWAVKLVDEYSGVPLDEDLARRIEAGWSFNVPAERVGEIILKANEAPQATTLDGNRFLLQFLVSDSAVPALKRLEVSLPDEGETAKGIDVNLADIIRIHQGPRAYIFRLEEVRGDVAHFSVWKQSPSFRQPAAEESSPESAAPPAPAMPDTVNE